MKAMVAREKKGDGVMPTNLFNRTAPVEAANDLSDNALREAFSLFDLDDDGCISGKELKAIMQKLGNPLTDMEVKDIIAEAGSGKTNSITFAQFNKLMLGVRHQPLDDEEVLRTAFELFDRNGDGAISAKEMQDSIKGFGVPLSLRETDLLMAEAAVTSPDATLASKAIKFDLFKKVVNSG